MPLDLLIIMLGTNAFKSRFNVSPLDISWSIGRLVKAARGSGYLVLGEAPDVLVLCPPPLADLSSSPFAEALVGAEEKSRQLASVLGAFCDDNNYVCLMPVAWCRPDRSMVCIGSQKRTGISASPWLAVALLCFANVLLPNAGKNYYDRLVFLVEKKRARLLSRAL
jgi:hypothetical protein